MKHSKLCGVLLATVLVVVAISETSFADLNASEIQANFNSMNGGQGFRFTYVSGVTLTTSAGYTNVDTSAYGSSMGGTNTSGLSYFKTFCVEPSASVSGTLVGKLNYSGGLTQTSAGFKLSLGAAMLYKEYAVDGSRTSTALQTAIQALMGITTVSNWATNTHLAYLLTVNNDKSYWTQAYDPGQYYGEIGNYSVFVMNVTTTSNLDRQDFLYIAKANGNGGDVPEPATLLLWTLGGLGVFGTSRARKRRMKQLA